MIDTYPTILTVSGHYFDFFKPEECEFDIEDIAHALSNICRFTGHVREFFSVAQHAVLVSYLVPPRLALHGLHHDDAEAFLGDVSRPLKQRLPDYKAIETRVEAAVLARFGMPYPMPAEVHDADRMALAWEKRDLMPPHVEPVGTWGITEGLVPPVEGIMPLPPREARKLFLWRYKSLTS